MESYFTPHMEQFDIQMKYSMLYILILQLNYNVTRSENDGDFGNFSTLIISHIKHTSNRPNSVLHDARIIYLQYYSHLDIPGATCTLWETIIFVPYLFNILRNFQLHYGLWKISNIRSTRLYCLRPGPLSFNNDGTMAEHHKRKIQSSHFKYTETIWLLRNSI